MPTRARLDRAHVTTYPGDEFAIELTVDNIGFTAGGFTVVADGPAREWMLLDPPVFELPAGSSQDVLVLVRPPRHWSTSQGEIQLEFRVVPHDVDDEVSLAEIGLTVLPLDDHQLSFASPIQRGRRRATFPVVAQNLGNRRSTFRLVPVDRSGRVVGRVDPPSLGIEPGGTAHAVLSLKARRRRWGRIPRALPFELHGVSNDRAPVATRATLVQEPVVPWRAAGLALVGGAVAAGLITGWLYVGRPTVERAGRSAWQAHVASLPPRATVDPTRNVAAAPLPFNARVEVTAAIGGEQVSAVEVPAGRRLRITDALFQNPDGARGRMALLRDATVLYEAGLQNFADLVDTPVTPFVFGPGERVLVQMKCTGTQQAAAQSCTAAITLSGELTAADA